MLLVFGTPFELCCFFVLSEAAKVIINTKKQGFTSINNAFFNIHGSQSMFRAPGCSDASKDMALIRKKVPCSLYATKNFVVTIRSIFLGHFIKHKPSISEVVAARTISSS